MGKKILVPCFDVIMIAFSSLLLEIWYFTVYFSGKGRSLSTSKHGTRIFFPITILFKENFKKKYPENRSKIQTKRAHAPWASHNTPKIELIQYGRRIGKKVYFKIRSPKR